MLEVEEEGEKTKIHDFVFIKKRQKIEEQLGKDFEEILQALNGQFPHEKTAKILSEAYINHHSKFDLLIQYYILGERLQDASYPITPYFLLKNQEKLWEIEEQDIVNAENNWLAKWEEQRQLKYREGKNVLYEKDYMKEWLDSVKYPVIGHGSLSYFFDQLYFRLSKSNDTLKVNAQNFMQTIFTLGHNGRITRFAKVVEIIPVTKKAIDGREYETYDWAISLKVMPDDDLNHSSCVLRLESKHALHHNIFGSKNDQKMQEFASKKDQNDAKYFRKTVEAIYKTNVCDCHIHWFDRLNRLVYLKRPLSSNVIPFHHLLSYCKQDYHDDSYFASFMIKIKSDEKLITQLEQLSQELNLADLQISKERSGKRKEGWLHKFFCLKLANTLVDSVLNIEQEKEWNSVKQRVLSLLYGQDVVLEEPEQKEVVDEEDQRRKMQKKEKVKNKQEAKRQERLLMEQKCQEYLAKKEQEKLEKIQNTKENEVVYTPKNKKMNRKMRNQLKMAQKSNDNVGQAFYEPDR